MFFLRLLSVVVVVDVVVVTISLFHCAEINNSLRPRMIPFVCIGRDGQFIGDTPSARTHKTPDNNHHCSSSIKGSPIPREMTPHDVREC